MHLLRRSSKIVEDVLRAEKGKERRISAQKSRPLFLLSDISVNISAHQNSPDFKNQVHNHLIS